MFPEHVDRLVSLGLSQKEAKVYLTLLNEGELDIQSIARITSFNRSTTYVQLADLTKLGLISSYKKGKRVIFAAESPNNLERLIEKYALELQQKKSEVSTILPELMKSYGSTGSRPIVRMFEGKDGLTAMRNNMLEESPKYIYVISSVDEMRKVYTSKELNSFTAKREKSGIKTCVLYSLKEGDDLEAFPLQTLKRVTQESLPFGSDVYIYGDTVSFASIGDSIIGMTVTNGGIAKTMRGMFDVLWASY